MASKTIITYFLRADIGGTLSNFGYFQNCTFTGNRATTYGAAIAAFTIQDMTRVEIDNWSVS